MLETYESALRRVIERLITEPLSERILSGELKQGSRVFVDVDKERIIFFIGINKIKIDKED